MIHKILTVKIAEAINELYSAEVLPETVLIEKTKKDFEGDYTFVVFPYLKISRKSPEMTAKEIGEFLVARSGEIKGYTIIRGFLNISVRDDYWIRYIMNQNPAEQGFRQNDPGKPVTVVEFSSPNTNKPLHLGHVRNNLLGHAVSEILKANGHTVIKVNLVNDRGIHICKSMLAYQKWGSEETPDSAGIKGDHLVGKYYVMFDQQFRSQVDEMVLGGMSREEAEKKAPLLAEAQELLRKWESHEEQAVSLWRRMNGWVYQGFDQTYSRLGIFFDKTYYESDTYLLGKKLVLEGLASGAFFEKTDGSVWIDLTNDGLDEKLLLRADGTSVYITQDLGTAELRYDDYRPDEMIYVVGNEQNYHFDVLKKVLKKLGRNYSDSILHLSYGMVELPEGKMKSREGTVVDADDLMNEMFNTAEQTTRELGKADELTPHEANELFETVGMGALKYFILKVDPKKNMLFDPSESIDFNGNTGPFIQYTHARICSLIKKASISDVPAKSDARMEEEPLLGQERELIMMLYAYPEMLAKAGNEKNPAVVANFVYDLSKTFNQLYQELPVLKEANPVKTQLRLRLALLTGKIIATSMELLGIRVPEKM